MERNKLNQKLYRDKFLDLISILIDDKGTVPVFTPDHHYISQDCEHFSKGGAVYYASLIDWSRFIK